MVPNGKIVASATSKAGHLVGDGLDPTFGLAE